MEYRVERLKINYKTLEEFKEFKEYGLQDLSMLEDLEANIIENDIDSPFYGIYFGGRLVARMSMYHVDQSSYPNETGGEYLDLRKLEVLPNYQNKGLGTALVQFAKQFNLPIKTVAKLQSKDFWFKMGFTVFDDKTEKAFDESSLIWFPPSYGKQTFVVEKPRLNILQEISHS